MKSPLLALIVSLSLFVFPISVSAVQTAARVSPSPENVIEATVSASESAQIASESAALAELLAQLQKDDLTKPEETPEKAAVLELFKQRPEASLNPINFMAYTVQYAVNMGIPANTIVLILLLPVLASMIAFIRLVVGLPSMEMLVPIILSVSLIATGLTAGSILIISILIASLASRVILKKVRIMQLPKMSLSLFLVSIMVFLSLLLSAQLGILSVQYISIFPILVFILLSDKIVSLQLQRSLLDTLNITFLTIIIGLLGYAILQYNPLREAVLLYPELILLLIPLNLIIGRYFGLRLTEYFRFKSIKSNGN